MQQNNKQPNIAFLIGMGRSGTTLLTNMLNSHVNLVATPENKFLIFTYHTFYKKNFNNISTINSFLKVFNYNLNKVISIWKPLPKVKEDLVGLRDKNFANVCKSVYLNYPFIGTKSEINYIIDKNPDYSLHIDTLNKIYPTAKYILLVRDYRDNILSRKIHANKVTSIYDLAAAWNYYYNRIFKSIKKHDLSYHLIRYEDLVTNPKEILTNLCNYIGVNYSEEMLSFQGLSKEIINHVKINENNKVYEKIKRMHSNLENQVNDKRIKSYEKELSSKDISILNYICFRNGKKFNYIKKKEKHISLVWILKSKLAFLKIIVYYTWRSFYYTLPISLRYYFLKKV
jgi:hypothetical protein